MEENEIKYLINLLDDPDRQVFKIVSEKIIDHGPEIVPGLEKAWETSFDQQMQEKIENIIHSIQFNHVKKELGEWAKTGGHDLLYGVFLIAKYQYPELEMKDIESQIEVFRRDAWLEIHDNLTALEKVRVINHILFAIHNLSRNTTNFYSPRNSFINQVLETKKGNPISLSIIYLVIAQKLDLPIFGVNLPLNYILAYKESYYQEDPDNILFYINPYNQGNVLSRKDIDKFLHDQKIEPKKEFYLPCSNSVTVERMLRNLLFAYEKMGYPDKADHINEMLSILRSNRTQKP